MTLGVLYLIYRILSGIASFLRRIFSFFRIEKQDSITEKRKEKSEERHDSEEDAFEEVVEEEESELTLSTEEGIGELTEAMTKSPETVAGVIQDWMQEEAPV